MRIPRRAAVVVSALALTGSLAACADDTDGGTGTGTDTGVEDPVAPADPGVGGEIDDEGLATEPEED